MFDCYCCERSRGRCVQLKDSRHNEAGAGTGAELPTERTARRGEGSGGPRGAQPAARGGPTRVLTHHPSAPHPVFMIARIIIPGRRDAQLPAAPSDRLLTRHIRDPHSRFLCLRMPPTCSRLSFSLARSRSPPRRLPSTPLATRRYLDTNRYQDQDTGSSSSKRLHTHIVLEQHISIHSYYNPSFTIH